MTSYIHVAEIIYNPIIENIIGEIAMSQDIVKICKKCGPLTIEQVVNYGGNHINECIACKREAGRAWNARNKEHKVAYQKQYAKDHKEQVNAGFRRRRAADPTKFHANEKKYREGREDELYARQSKRLYGITSQQYAEMLAAQNGLCAICKNPETKKSRTLGKTCRLAIDHNHKTGKVRGLLCHDCNIAIGCFKEDQNLIDKAIAYLERHQT